MPTLELPYIAPYAWDYHVRFYQWYAVRPVETMTADLYTRDFMWAGATGRVEVRCDAAGERLIATYTHPHKGAKAYLRQRLTHLFDLGHNPAISAEALHRVPHFKQLQQRHPGVRLPTGFDPWESALSVILGQLIGIKQAQQLLTELLSRPEAHSPEGLANLDLAFLKTTGIKKLALHNLARAVVEGQVDLTGAQPLADFERALLALKGIGPWTASSMAMRCLGHCAAFPAKDLVVARALATLPKGTADAIAPYRGYLTALLWRHYAMTD